MEMQPGQVVQKTNLKILQPTKTCLTYNFFLRIDIQTL